MKNLTAILFTLLLSFSASAEIRELQYMQHAVYDAQKGDVVVFDIDNTILEPVQTLGSDQWFEYMLHKNKAAGMSDKKAFSTTVEYWTYVQEVTEVRPVEKITPSLIKELQDRGIMVIGLTARPKELNKTSVQQLNSLGVRLKNYRAKFDSIKDVEFYKGILFVGSNNKGLVLSQFLKEQNINPTRLLFIDDKQKNVKNVDDAFLNSGIVNINFRYGAADKRVKSFSTDIAEVQWEMFVAQGILLTDEEASQIEKR